MFIPHDAAGHGRHQLLLLERPSALLALRHFNLTLRGSGRIALAPWSLWCAGHDPLPPSESLPKSNNSLPARYSVGDEAEPYQVECN